MEKKDIKQETRTRLGDEKSKEGNDSNEEKRKVVMHGAKIQCKYCLVPGTLLVTSNQVKLQDQLWATEADKQKTNLYFPGQCMHSSWGYMKPLCQSVIMPLKWENIGTTLVQDNKVLLKSSTIKCGISNEDIEIIFEGQTCTPTNLSTGVGAVVQTPQKMKKEEKNKIKIAIDPGHGDHNDRNKQIDPGAVNGEIYEKDIALHISTALKNALADDNKEIILTRDGDIENAGKKLEWRIDAAKGMDIFISIHINSSSNSLAKGFSVCYKLGNEKSKDLANEISKTNSLFKSRGLDPRTDLYVLNRFSGISVLIEAGFISNKEDLDIMTTKADTIGSEIAAGVNNYLKGVK